jgi:hypothetical protein
MHTASGLPGLGDGGDLFLGIAAYLSMDPLVHTPKEKIPYNHQCDNLRPSEKVHVYGLGEADLRYE